MDTLQLVGAITILAATIAGGWFPLQSKKDNIEISFPKGEAFSAGVFLALSLTMMLPSASGVLHHALPKINYPIASLVAIVSFLSLLAVSHLLLHMESGDHDSPNKASSPALPIVMTAMIAFPSFFMGTAIAVSPPAQAILIVIAVLMHKSSAAFALTLKMMKSSMTKREVWIGLFLFALSTPLGIVFGAILKSISSGETILMVRGFVLAMASGVFLFMAVLHDLRKTAMIEHCCYKRGFIWLLAGFALTALVRFVIGEAHHIH